MRPPAANRHGHRCGALAAGLDLPVGRLAEDRQVGGQPFRVLGLDPGQPVAFVLDLLAVVEHEGQVADGLPAWSRRGAAASRHRTSCRWCRSRAGCRRPAGRARCRRSARCRCARPAAPWSAGRGSSGPAPSCRPAPPEVRQARSAASTASAIGPSVPDTEAMSTSAAVSSAGSDAQVEDDRSGRRSLRGWRTRTRTVPSLACASRSRSASPCWAWWWCWWLRLPLGCCSGGPRSCPDRSAPCREQQPASRRRPPVNSPSSSCSTPPRSMRSAWPGASPEQGRIIAVATAYQESSLRNRPDGDRDSRRPVPATSVPGVGHRRADHRSGLRRPASSTTRCWKCTTGRTCR